MAMFTYLIAFGHFGSEWLIFRSATTNPGLLSPVFVASMWRIFYPYQTYLDYTLTAGSLIWMFQQYDFYVKK